MASWLIYAMGGGFGHLTRAASLARAARFPGRQITILTNSPYAGQVRQAMPDLNLAAIDPALEIAAARREVVRYIELAGADCLVVDTFPRGLVGELVEVLAAFHGLKVLVHRDLNPQYGVAFEVEAFMAARYDLVLIPGDAAVKTTETPSMLRTEPWLIRCPHELLPRESARVLLRIRGDRPCIIVCASGNREELAWYGAATRVLIESHATCDVRCVATACPPGCPAENWLSYWPAMDLYSAVDVVVGSAGYNTVYECIALHLPLIARPWPRKYDRQALRLALAVRSGCAQAIASPADAVPAVREVLGRAERNEPNLQFKNGVADAVERIEAALRS